MKTKSIRRCFIMGAVLLFITSVASADNQNGLNHLGESAQGGSHNTAEVSSPAPLTEQEKKYLLTISTFLSVLSTETKNVGDLSIDAEKGKVSMENLKEGILSAQKKSAQAYRDYYNQYGNKKIVPQRFKEIDLKVNKIFDLLATSYKESLKYFEDHDGSHFESANASVQESIKLINELNKMLEHD